MVMMRRKGSVVLGGREIFNDPLEEVFDPDKTARYDTICSSLWMSMIMKL